MFDLGYKFEKNVRFRIQIWKKRYGMFFECLCTKQNAINEEDLSIVRDVFWLFCLASIRPSDPNVLETYEQI